MDQPLNNQPSISPIKKPIGAERLSNSSKNVFGTQSTSTSPPLINNAGSSDFGSTNDLNINKVITPPLGSNNSSNNVIPTIKVNPIRPNSTSGIIFSSSTNNGPNVSLMKQTAPVIPIINGNKKHK